MSGERLDISTTDGVLDCYLFEPPGQRSWPTVVVYMDAFGIRPALASMVERIASAGFVAALPNLYYRSGAFMPFDASRVFTDGPERDRFKGRIASITPAMVMRDTSVVIDRLAARPTVRPGPMAALGYCMGGGYALSAAATFPDTFGLAASFHGGSLATDRPDSPHRLASQMRARVYIGAAAIDPSFDEAQEGRLREAFDAAGVRYALERYVGARHGFAVTGHPAYDRDAAETHWETLLDMLRDTLSPHQEET
jgi:carboxymethylenebutenolidase